MLPDVVLGCLGQALETPGGGGLGDPAERDPAAVRDDVLNGYVSEDAARKVYGDG